MEFIVAGAPRSANARPRSRRRWRERVAEAAREHLHQGGELFDQDVGVLIIYFFQGETTLDVDNIAKSMLDGLKGVLFRDDAQVSELRVRKSRVSAGLSLTGASIYLLDTIERMLQTGSDFVYVRAGPQQDPMSGAADIITSDRDAIRQYADWYSEQGYQVSIKPSPRELPEFLRTLAPDMIARRDGENIVVEVKTSSPASFEQVQRLARALENRAGWKLRVVYVDLADPEWAPPSELPGPLGLEARLASMGSIDGEDDHSRLQFLLLWSIIEAAARHRLSPLEIPPARRISSSALIKMLLTEGIIEDEDYSALRRGLAVRNAVAHGFLNQSVDAALFDDLRKKARGLLRSSARS